DDDRVADTRAFPTHPPGWPSQTEGQIQYRPFLSADGRWIAYTCNTCHLVTGQQNGHTFSDGADVFLYDRQTGSNTLVSHASGSALTTGDRDSQALRVSADGRFVVFTSGSP